MGAKVKAEPPNISLVSETDPAELEKEQAARELGWDIRDMSANLLRVMRGAGRPHLLPQQIINLGEAILKTHESARAWAIWSAMQEILEEGVPGGWESSEVEEGEGTIVKGSLQIAASRLVKQHAQEAAGSRQIADGIRDLERCQERHRREWREESAAMAIKLAQRTVARRKLAKKAKATKAPTIKAVADQSPVTGETKDRPTSTADFMKARQRELRGDKE